MLRGQFLIRVLTLLILSPALAPNAWAKVAPDTAVAPVGTLDAATMPTVPPSPATVAKPVCMLGIWSSARGAWDRRIDHIAVTSHQDTAPPCPDPPKSSTAAAPPAK